MTMMMIGTTLNAASKIQNCILSIAAPAIGRACFNHPNNPSPAERGVLSNLDRHWLSD